MTPDRIKHLLEKYWEGETTLEEEKALKSWFSRSDSDPGFETERQLFQHFSREAAEQMPEKSTGRNPLGMVFRYAAAACLIGLLGFGLWMWKAQTTPDKIELADTYDDPEKAYAEIKAALALVSRKMEKGQKEAARGINKIGRANAAIPGRE